MLALGVAALLSLLLAGSASSARTGAAPSQLARVELHLRADAHRRPQVVLMTLGGPVYCAWLEPLARKLKASRICPDFQRNGESSAGTSAARMEDWGDPAYLDYVAKLPDQLRKQGVKISKLVFVGVSYSGYANAQLVATHPELRPAALVVIDSYLDLATRFARLPSYHRTYKELVTMLGGTPAERGADYAARSPSGNLDGLADAIRHGTRLLVVWSVAPGERRLFNGATCSIDANARWLGALAGRLGAPVTGYVTTLPHARVLRSWKLQLLALVGVGPSPPEKLPAQQFTFMPGAAVPAASYCP